MNRSDLALVEMGHYLEEIILLTDTNRVVHYCNKEVNCYFGTASKLFDPDFPENQCQKNCRLSSYFYDLAQIALQGKMQCQTMFMNDTGAKVTIEWKVIQAPSQVNGEPVTLLLTGKDISAECNKNEKIDELETELNGVIEVMAGNYWWKDSKGIYKGFNQSLLTLLGVTREEVVGHSDYDLPWANTADELVRNDQLVITSGLPYKTEEEIKAANGDVRIFDIFKIPLKNKKGEVIGTIGNSIDITERKRTEAHAKKEAEKTEQLRSENERQQIALEEKEKFAQLARKVAHDMSSPLTALQMMITQCDELPEDKRISLNRATESISDIFNNLLRNSNQKQNRKTITSEAEPRQPLLVSELLTGLLSEKKSEYHNHPVAFVNLIADEAHFAFIQCQPTEFRRAISNLINNAVDALKDKAGGTVTTQLTLYDGALIVEIADNGCGMPSVMKEKIRRRQSFTMGKEKGHGLGLQQIWDTLEYNEGTMDVQSTPRQGTSIKLAFPLVEAASWIAMTIHLIPDSIIVILDDDDSIHAAWNLRFASFLKAYPDLQIHHFTQGHKVLEFLEKLSLAEKGRVFFLSDYELLHQNRNGLQIIESSAIERTILVTSYYFSQQIQEAASHLKVKILPKKMASVIPVAID